MRLVQVRADIWVANMIGQHGILRPWETMRSNCRHLCICPGSAAAWPETGWDRIKPLTDAALCHRGIPVTVDDFNA